MGVKFDYFLATGLAVGMLGISEQALAKDTLPGELLPKAKQLAPISNWVLDYAQDNCRLVRTFGSTDDRHFLAINQAWPHQGFSLTLAGSSFRRYRRGARAHMGLQSDVPMLRFDLPPMGEMDTFGPAVVLASVGVDSEGEGAHPRLRVGEFPSGSETQDEAPTLLRAGLDPAEGAKIERVIIKAHGKTTSFETGNLKSAFEALNACGADLLKDWGLDAEKHISYLPAQWLNQEEVVRRLQRRYPSAALRAGKQAIFRMRVIIDEQGAIAECEVNAATTVEKLESPACEEMLEARFSPALDKNGQPMRSFYASTISYRIN